MLIFTAMNAERPLYLAKKSPYNYGLRMAVFIHVESFGFTL